jgi:hypothetical protein
MVDHVETSKHLSALRQVRAAIAHFHKGEFECAMTLAAAGEGQLPEKGMNFLLRILKLRAPAEDFNLFINRDERLAERDAVEEAQGAHDLIEPRPRNARRHQMNLESADIFQF